MQIRQAKKELRHTLKEVRKNIKDKTVKDKMICNNILSSDIYINAKAVLFYAALDNEINIDECIIYALKQGKKVALPVCTDNNGNMTFYYIKSINDVKLGHFSVREPDTSKCLKVTSYEDCICFVPGISFNSKGYRLGYGKGYYDRFLSKHSLISVGVCYNELINDNIPIDEYDASVDYIITQDKMILSK